MSTVALTAATLIELLNRVIPFAGTDPTLPVLVTVQLEVADGWLTASTTDRYRVGHARTKVTDDAEPFKFLLALADARQVVKLFSGPVDAVTLTATPTELVVAGARISLRFDVVSGEAVSFRKLVANAQQCVDRSAAPFAVNMNYVADFAKAVGRNEPMRVTPGSASVKPILFEARDFVGLLMPVRISDQEFGFEVTTGEEIRIGFTPTVAFEKRIARKPKVAAS